MHCPNGVGGCGLAVWVRRLPRLGTIVVCQAAQQGQNGVLGGTLPVGGPVTGIGLRGRGPEEGPEGRRVRAPSGHCKVGHGPVLLGWDDRGSEGSGGMAAVDAVWGARACGSVGFGVHLCQPLCLRRDLSLFVGQVAQSWGPFGVGALAEVAHLVEDAEVQVGPLGPRPWHFADHPVLVPHLRRVPGLGSGGGRGRGPRALSCRAVRPCLLDGRQHGRREQRRLGPVGVPESLTGGTWEPLKCTRPARAVGPTHGIGHWALRPRPLGFGGRGRRRNLAGPIPSLLERGQISSWACPLGVNDAGVHYGLLPGPSRVAALVEIRPVQC
mmetsp:Transcript_1003/g.2085  ORF Transcript_1003/g.2085 Transcript_1003/m.2085 type:complete len:326 (-) Transcript_1003:1634-2611(-)